MSQLLLDAGMGTALLDAGLPSLPEAWLFERPEAIAAVHRAHAAAGAQVVLTCTFNLAGPRLRDEGVEEGLEALAMRAVELARAAAPGARVAGAVGPTLLAGSAPESALRERFEAPFRALAAAGCDLLWTESHWDLPEARAALSAARAAGLPAVTTFTFRDEGGALAAASGEPALACLEELAQGTVAVGANCLLPGAPLEGLLRAAASRLALPLIAKPSAGLPGSLLTPEAFGAWVLELSRAGARWVGGCCGSGAAHLEAAGRAVRQGAQARG